MNPQLEPQRYEYLAFIQGKGVPVSKEITMKTNKKTKLYQLQQKVNNGIGECSKCKRQDHLTVDHIIPVSLLLMMGFTSEEINNDDENFDVLCRWCNKMKGAKLDHLNVKTIPLLKKYVHQFELWITPNNNHN